MPTGEYENCKFNACDFSDTDLSQMRFIRCDFTGCNLSLAKLSKTLLILDTKGQDTEQDQVKRRYLDEWTRAVNAHGGFGHWSWAVAKAPGEIRDILMQQDLNPVD